MDDDGNNSMEIVYVGSNTGFDWYTCFTLYKKYTIISTDYIIKHKIPNECKTYKRINV